MKLQPPPGCIHEDKLARFIGMSPGGNIKPKLEGWGIYNVWLRPYRGAKHKKEGARYYLATDALKAAARRREELRERREKKQLKMRLDGDGDKR